MDGWWILGRWEWMKLECSIIMWERQEFWELLNQQLMIFMISSVSKPLNCLQRNDNNSTRLASNLTSYSFYYLFEAKICNKNTYYLQEIDSPWQHIVMLLRLNSKIVSKAKELLRTLVRLSRFLWHLKMIESHELLVRMLQWTIMWKKLMLILSIRCIFCIKI